jgi:Fe-S cluster biogenesis protein NfuA
MLAVCDYDYHHNARFLGSRNRAIILVFLDTGIRLSELIAMKLSDIELVNVQDGVVSIRLKGACFRCPMSTVTLKMGIERVLREKVPGVKEVLSV